MMLTVAVATLRTRWVAFAGTLAALALGVSVIATMTLVLAAADDGGHRSPERFAAAPFVIQADPALRAHDAGGTDTVPLLEQPDVPASAVAQLPGATADRSFYAQLDGAPAGQPPLGHGWSSAAFAPYRLSSGHPPRTDGEIVVAGPAVIGRPVTVLTAGGPLAVTIVGTVQPRTGEQPVFFTDAEAARLSPGVDALVTDDPATARRAQALGGLQVLTGAARHQADPDAVQDGVELAGLTTFLGIAAAISAFVAIAVIASAFGLSVAQRRRDLALLRTVGATPRQVARMVRTEAALVGVAGSALGCLLGVLWAPLLARWIAGRSLSPAWFSVQFTAGSAPALAVAFVAGVAVAVASVLVAARRAGLTRPTEALREAVVEPARISPGRLFGGLGCLVAGIGTLAAVALLFPSAAGDAKTEATIVLLLVGGAVLLAPFLIEPLTRPFGRGTAGMLIRAGVRTGPGRAAAAVVPVLITVGLAVSILGSSDTAGAAAQAGLRQQAGAADYVVLPASGTPGLTMALVGRIHAIADLDATAVTQTSLLAHEPAITAFHLEAPMPIPFAAIGVDRASAALSLPVRQGSLADLGDHTIAVDSSWHERLGATMSLWLPDGTPVSLRVVAILAPSLSGVSLVVDAANAGGAMPSAVYVRLGGGAASAADAAVDSLRAVARQAGARVVPASLWSAAVSDQQNEQNQVGLELLLGIAIAYSAIGIASTSLMSTSGRKAELALLRLAGATRRQVAWILAAESLALTFAAVAASAAISGLVLGGLWVALARAAGFTPIVLPWLLIGVIAGASALIGVVASILPALGSTGPS
ncbi:MAG TPA: FtsX-like permease family protein [Trebonia sp.]